MRIRMCEEAEAIDSQRTTYATPFKIKNIKGLSIDNYKKAKRYLEKEEMLNYYHKEGEDKLESIKWCLCDNENGDGFVVVTALEPLSKECLNSLSGYIAGQNSDGLGESFEQKFRTVKGLCSFDRHGSDYKLHEFGNHFSSEFWKKVKRYTK